MSLTGFRKFLLSKEGSCFSYRGSKLSTLKNTASSFSETRLVSSDVRFPWPIKSNTAGKVSNEQDKIK